MGEYEVLKRWLLRDERRKEERSKQGQTNNKAKQHNTLKAVTFPKKNELPQVHVVLDLQACTLAVALVPRSIYGRGKMPSPSPNRAGNEASTIDVALAQNYIVL